MNHTINFATDTATVALFDVAVMKHRLEESADWWCFDLSELDEVCDGRMALFSTGGDGSFKVRLASGDLTQDEKDYASVHVPTLGFETVSGQIFVGAAEELPSGGFFPSPTSPDDLLGEFVPIPPGRYDLEIYGIDWFISPRWWNDDYLTPPDAPADVVVIAKPRQNPFVPPESEPRLVNDHRQEFLFPSESRVIGPIPDMVLTTKVWKREGALTLKQCGPLDYKPYAQNLVGVNWRDRVKVRVLTVDHEERTMQVELINP